MEVQKKKLEIQKIKKKFGNSKNKLNLFFVIFIHFFFFLYLTIFKIFSHDFQSSIQKFNLFNRKISGLRINQDHVTGILFAYVASFLYEP